MGETFYDFRSIPFREAKKLIKRATNVRSYIDKVYACYGILKKSKQSTLRTYKNMDFKKVVVNIFLFINLLDVRLDRI